MKIIVLCGGTSTEREVSLNSGAAVENALRTAGFETSCEDIVSIAAFVEKWPSYGADGVFVALHGGWGEDGRLQAALDAAGIRYTGSGPKSCKETMDKETAREAMRRNGIPVPPGFAVTHDEPCDLRRAIDAYGRIVVKPASGGSTVGVTITDEIGEAVLGLARVWDIDTKAIVERFIPGKEVTVAVFGNGDDAFAMPAIEIRPRSGFYDYRSKYTKGASEYICPAGFEESLTAQIGDYAVRAHRIFGCKAYSRVDFRITPEGEVFVLEVNTAPGMTATSLVPKAAAAYGWDFPELLRRIVRDAIGMQ